MITQIEEMKRLAKADLIIDDYAMLVKKQLRDTIEQYIRANPGWYFDHIDFKYDETQNQYHLTPVYSRLKDVK